MKKVDIVFFGTPSFSAYILEKLIKFGFHVNAVVTSPDKPVGRKQIITQSAVSDIAQQYDIPILKPAKLSELDSRQLSIVNCQLFIVASFGKIIPQALLDLPKFGAINIHGSLLPKYRGASPIQTAILNGDKQTGITIMLMDEEMDHGPILATEKIAISDSDTFESLSNKMAKIAAPLLIKTAQKFISGKIKPQSQHHAAASYCNLVKKADGYCNIDNPPEPEVLDRMIRAYYPWPNAWTKWNGKIVKFLLNQMIQMEGKKSVSLKDFLNGYPDFPLKNLLKLLPEKKL